MAFYMQSRRSTAELQPLWIAVYVLLFIAYILSDNGAPHVRMQLPHGQCVQEEEREHLQHGIGVFLHSPCIRWYSMASNSIQ